METLEKINIEKLKNDIKTKVEEQKFYINQRRTVRLVGERKLEPWVAAMKHASNREQLRLLYAAYGAARGMKYSQVENHYPEDDHPLHEYQWKIDKILSEYTIKPEE